VRVILVAQTVVDRWAVPEAGYRPHGGTEVVTSADELAEFAGRACYQSYDRPNPDTATNAGYLANILTQQHFSVLEHASATFYIDGVSRALTHELVRHRHLSYSQLSQRFVNAATMEPVIPPAFADDGDWSDELRDIFSDALDAYGEAVRHLEAKGLGRKQAREAARAVLPNMTSTAIVVTGNMRAWREVIAKRSSPAADAEIRELAGRILDHLRVIAPHTVQDFT
jgi:thymidylate synthase (FAD)